MASRGRILIIDDDAETRTGLASRLRGVGFSIETAADGFKSVRKIEEFRPDVLLTDLHMPGMDGLELMDKASALLPGSVCVVMTSAGSIESAVRAMQRGAMHYMTKPLDLDALAAILDRAVESSRARNQRARERDGLRSVDAFDEIIGQHPSIHELRKHVALIAPSRASVLIEGESGTGKGLIAEAIHRASARSAHPFVRLSCAALTESLLESEIFGHEKGSFTGAAMRREGRFKQAEGGTLFLDEVSEIPASTQVKLLRFLQERSFERVGGNETLRVDVRVIAATNRSLLECVQAGTFRQDLYYRLNVVPLKVPALRERPSDIPLLAAHFLLRFSRDNGKAVSGFSDEALDLLSHYSWPGNVRELENVLEHAVVICDAPLILPRHLPSNLSRDKPRDAMPEVPGATVYELERWAILRTLQSCGGSTSRAAGILGISPRKIQYKLHEYGGSGRPSTAHRQIEQHAAVLEPTGTSEDKET
ncbi:MAG: sigma-54-dependent Fis family transcriptional regulator [Deltaproteobacteria bacterium]|nr:sigma-54-dependent Fis family transcriptional regulator [Deltaproteobacteria bacterium]